MVVVYGNNQHQQDDRSAIKSIISGKKHRVQDSSCYSKNHKRSGQEEVVMLVEDIIEGDDQQGDGNKDNHDRLRRIFSKRIRDRGPKTPPRRVHSDKLSNSVRLVGINIEQHSQEAQSLYIQEESDPSILYTESKNFAQTEQSRRMLGKYSQVVSGNFDKEDSSDYDDDEERNSPDKRKKKSSNMLSKIKSACVLPNRPKKKERNKQKTKILQGQQQEEQKDGGIHNSQIRKRESKNLLSRKKNRKKPVKHRDPTSPKKSGRKFFNLLNSGPMIGLAQTVGQIVAMGGSNDDESNNNTLGLSMDSSNQIISGDANNLKSINSSNMPLGKKTRTQGILGRSRMSGKNKLSKKATQVVQKSKAQIISYWNLFLNEGTNYQQYYKTIKKIGQGGCGEVLMVMHLPTDQIRAMKVIKKNSEKVVTSVFDEINVLRQLDHPNIVKIYEYFQDDQNLYIIMEYLKGGSLFERLKSIVRFGEREAAYVMKQVLQALNYCFQKKIVHRDMKLENILFVQEDSLQIKIIDFGSAVALDSPVKNLNRIVTAYYVAPEIVNKESAFQKCDVWSCGVILFILLSGQAPFRGKDEQEIIEKVMKAQVNFDDNSWKSVSSRAKFLIKAMLELNVKNRSSLQQCIQSNWIKMLTKIDGSFRIDMHQIAKTIRLLEEFQPGCKLRLLCLHYSLVYFNFDTHIDKFSKYYSYIDSRNVANLNERDFMKFAQRIHKEEDLEVLLQQQKQTVAKLDINKSNGITFSDFLIGTLDFPKLLTSQKLIKLFNLMDKDGDNYISIKDLWLFSAKRLTLDQCKQVLEEAQDYSTKSPYGMPQQQQTQTITQQPSPLVQSQSFQIGQDSLLKLNFSTFKFVVHSMGSLPKQDQQQNNGTSNVQPQNTGYLNNNSYLLMMEGGNRPTHEPQHPVNMVQSNHNSGILYNAGVPSNTSHILRPVSQLLDNKPSILPQQRHTKTNVRSGSKNSKPIPQTTIPNKKVPSTFAPQY